MFCRSKVWLRNRRGETGNRLLHRALILVSMFAIFAAGTAPAQAERRVALVIGNGQYQGVAKLPNPVNDATALADTLKGLGFDQVTLRTDLGRDQFNSALRDFAREADRADWAVIYYAGHGMEIGGINYMIPVDAKLATDRDIEFEAIDLNKVLTSVDSAAKLKLVVLDACRDNPFVNQMKRSVGSRSIGRGLGQVDSGGTMVVYAAKHGQTASDGDGRHSPFMTSLLKRIQTPNVEVRRLFDFVRADVMAQTRQQQQPFTYGSLPPEDYYFQRTAAVVPVPPPTPAVVPSPTPAPVPTPTVVAPPVPVTPAPAPAPSAWTAKDCPECPEMVSIPLASFVMGATPDEEKRENVPRELLYNAPQRAVTISQRFSLGRYEVTRSEYAAFVAATGRVSEPDCHGLSTSGIQSGQLGLSWRNPGFAQTEGDPVVCVSWQDATAYVEWLTKTTGKRYRLPSETEWEYAARAGTRAARYWGDDRNQACFFANVADYTAAQKLNRQSTSDLSFQCTDNFAYTAPVGKFATNAFGLHDMLGNVSEWVADCWKGHNWGGAHSMQEAWQGGSECRDRFARGGGWYSLPHFVRAASRFSGVVGNRNNSIGFRVARTD